MSALLGAFIVGFLVIGFVFAWMFSGMAMKLILLWSPSLGVVFFGGSLAYLISGVIGGAIMVVAVGFAWSIYEKWEYSDTYDRWIKKIDSRFYSE